MYAWIKTFGNCPLDCAPMPDGLLLGDVVGYLLPNGRDTVGIIRHIDDMPADVLCSIITVYRKETL